MSASNGSALSSNMTCNYCGREINGGTLYSGVLYCPMCASLINRNNAGQAWLSAQYSMFYSNPSCLSCGQNPKNGGSGICNCIMGGYRLT